MSLNYRKLHLILFLGSLVGMGFALYLEHVVGLNPCPLCVFQRVGLIGMGIFSLLALLHNPAATWLRKGYTVLSTLAISWSVGVAARHVWLQTLPPDKVPSCGPGLDYLVEALPFKAVLQQVLSGSGECAVIDWTFLGQSLPVWSLMFFIVLFIINVFILVRR